MQVLSNISAAPQAGPASNPALLWPAGPAMLRLPEDDVHVWCARLDRPAGRTHLDEQVLSSDERERTARFRFPSDRLRFVAARAILRTLAGRYLELPGSAVWFRYGPFGKPSLDERQGLGLRFNLAHSGGLAVYAFARSREVGVDVEAEQSIRRPAAVPDSFFTASERQAIADLPADARRRAALTLWTRKEAYLKAVGCGLQLDPNDFEVSVPPVSPALLRVPDRLADGRRWILHDVPPAPGFAGCLCVEGDPSEVRAWSWNPADEVE